MKLKILFLIPAALSLLFVSFALAACLQSVNPEPDFSGDIGDIGLEVRLKELILDKTELATISGNTLKLNLTKFPAFATKSDVTWRVKCSLDCQSDCTGDCQESAVQIDQAGGMTTSIVTVPETSVIRVFSNDDPSVYTECSVSVFPDYGNYRYWNFTVGGWAAERKDSPAGERIPMNWVNGSTYDKDIGYGMTLRGGSGSGGYNQATTSPNGLPIVNGAIPPDADPALYPSRDYPNRGWVYTIDPEDPYGVGCNPTNGTRTGLNMIAEGDDRMGFASGHITTGGSGRIFSIAAIQGPFYIEVRYQTNSNGVPRFVDIRIGDKEGIRVQGETSNATGNNTLGNNNFGRIVSYYYEATDIVPYVYIEGAQAGAFRVYEVIILPEPPELE